MTTRIQKNLEYTLLFVLFGFSLRTANATKVNTVEGLPGLAESLGQEREERIAAEIQLAREAGAEAVVNNRAEVQSFLNGAVIYVSHRHPLPSTEKLHAKTGHILNATAQSMLPAAEQALRELAGVHKHVTETIAQSKPTDKESLFRAFGTSMTSAIKRDGKEYLWLSEHDAMFSVDLDKLGSFTELTIDKYDSSGFVNGVSWNETDGTSLQLRSDLKVVNAHYNDAHDNEVASDIRSGSALLDRTKDVHIEFAIDPVGKRSSKTVKGRAWLPSAMVEKKNQMGKLVPVRAHYSVSHGGESSRKTADIR